MKRFLGIVPFTMLVVAAPAMAEDWSGDWQIQGSIGSMPLSVVCTLVEKDHVLSGNCHNEQFPNLPLTGEADADHAKWTYQVDYQGQRMEVTYDAKRQSATEMEGSISVGGNPSGSFTANRPKA